MAGAADNFAAGLTSGVRNTLGNAGPLVRTSGDVAKSASSSTKALKTSIAQRSSISKALTDGGTPQSAARQLDDAAQAVDDGVAKVKTEDPIVAGPAEKNLLDNAGTNRIGAAGDAMSIKFGWPSGKTVLGLSAAVFCIYAIASFYGTDGKSITITKITPISATRVKIDYDPPGGSPAFCIRVADRLEFKNCSAGCTVPALATEQVISLDGPGSCIISKGLTSAGGLPYPAPAAAAATTSPAAAGTTTGPATSPIGTAYWGTAVVRTSLSNQFVGSVADVTATVFTTLGTAVGTGLAAGLDGLGNGLGLPGGPGDPDGGDGLCGLPIISSICGMGSTMKWVLGAVGIVLLLLLIYSMT